MSIINGLLIRIHPLAKFGQDFRFLLVKSPIRTQRYAQQQIAVLAHHIHQQLHDISRRLITVVVINRLVVMPTAQASTRLPLISYNFVGSTTLHIPHQSLALFFVQYLTGKHRFQFAVMRSHAMIIKVGGNLQSGIADGIERKHRHVKIQDIRIVAVDNVQCTVIEVGYILLRRHAGPFSPCPLAMNHTVVPAIFTQRMILGIQVLRVISFPPFAFPVCFGQLPIVRDAFLRTDCVVALSGLIPCPRMVGMQADTKWKAIFAGRLLPLCQHITFRSHIHGIPRLVLTVPKVEIIMMIA